MFELSGKDIKKKDTIREMGIGKVATHLCLTLVINVLKISVE